MPPADPNAAVNRLADAFWEGYLERYPMTATLLGDERYDDRLPDLGPDGRAADVAAFRDVLARAAAVGNDGLDPEATITRDMLVLVAESHLEFIDQKQYQLGVDHIFGPQTTPAEIARYQRADTPERLERLLQRYAAYPRMTDQYLRTLAEGIGDGRTSAEVPVQRAIEQIGRMLETPVAESPAVTQAQVPDESARERIREAAEAHIYPALRTLHEFLVHTYAPKARREPGISATPNGEEAYRLAIRMATTVASTPDEVHRFGLEDLEQIEAEKDQIANRLGHPDRHALREALAADADNRTDDPDRLVGLAKSQTARAFAAAAAYFSRLPREDCVVLPVEPYRERETPPAFYMPPALDGSRPGQYYINTYQPRERQLHNLAAITYHEATPGHHFQLAIEQELEGLPAFRRLGSRLAGVAYVEGWGLYCERLADEMGLYLDERERFGMLNAQSFRAARLVVDSGLHAFGWTRDRAIEFMHRRGSLPMVDAAIEVDRYTIWPGQALSYKIGQREIERARAEVSKQMGNGFDLRLFHDQVLAHGSVPLETLRREIPGWVDAVAARPA